MKQPMRAVALIVLQGAILGLPGTPLRAQDTPAGVGSAPGWVTAAVPSNRLRHGVFHSPAAQSEVSFHVLTPDTYDADPDRRYPVVYWLHGRGGGLESLPALAAHFDHAVRDGRMPPAIVVFPNGMATSMWCDSKDGAVPMETVVVKELVPHIDATFRTIASAAGRLVEGFSMGGYGAARLGLKYPDVFGAASILGAGPLQREFTPAVGSPGMRHLRARVLRSVYGGDQQYFQAQSPWLLAERNAEAVRGRLRLRQAIGGRDEGLTFNREFHAHLARLGIAHSFHVAHDVGHHPLALFAALGEANWVFYRQTLGRAVHRPADDAPKTHFLIVGKAMAADPEQQQERAAVAVRMIADAAGEAVPDARVETLVEEVMAKETFRRGEAVERVTGAVFREYLADLATIASPRDTVVIYTHSHGRQDGSAASEPLGGILMDHPLRLPEPRGVLPWEDYADLFLAIPARNVVVLTMSCFSGGLVRYLESPAVRERWIDRRPKEGRNLIILTSQDADRISPPIVKDGALINPFTHAVATAFAGRADGFGPATKAPDALPPRDGRLTVGELIDYVLHTTANTVSESPRRRNTAAPQVTGSHERDDVLILTSHAI